MTQPVTRRKLVGDLALGAFALTGVARWAHAAVQGEALVVYKDPNCECCAKWVQHMKANGFKPSVTETAQVDAIKKRYHVGDELRSCHTSVVGGYVIEGHVPAADVKRLLREKPKVVGLTIPGMPASAPGMDITPPQPYQVLAFDEKGKTTVYARH